MQDWDEPLIALRYTVSMILCTLRGETTGRNYCYNACQCQRITVKIMCVKFKKRVTHTEVAAAGGASRSETLTRVTDGDGDVGVPATSSTLPLTGMTVRLLLRMSSLL